jgi:hypothetical protein
MKIAVISDIHAGQNSKRCGMLATRGKFLAGSAAVFGTNATAACSVVPGLNHWVHYTLQMGVQHIGLPVKATANIAVQAVVEFGEPSNWSLRGYGRGPIIDLGKDGVLVALFHPERSLDGLHDPISLTRSPLCCRQITGTGFVQTIPTRHPLSGISRWNS